MTLLLADDGVFVVEVPHALELVEQNEFDGVYHEHVSQHTVKSFVDHFRLFGLEVFDVERLDVHGGSMRVFARRASNGARPVGGRSANGWRRSIGAGSLPRRPTTPSATGSSDNRVELLRILGELKGEGKRIVGYGASARGNTLLNYYRIGPETLDYIVDRNPLKQGLYSPGMHIPVEGPERLAEDDPDYVLVIAWNFAEEIARQQADYLGAGRPLHRSDPGAEARWLSRRRRARRARRRYRDSASASYSIRTDRPPGSTVSWRRSRRRRTPTWQLSWSSMHRVGRAPAAARAGCSSASSGSTRACSRCSRMRLPARTSA